jgi:hypothetical protein
VAVEISTISKRVNIFMIVVIGITKRRVEGVIVKKRYSGSSHHHDARMSALR